MTKTKKEIVDPKHKAFDDMFMAIQQFRITTTSIGSIVDDINRLQPLSLEDTLRILNAIINIENIPF